MYDQFGGTLEGPTKLESLDVDEACELLEFLGGEEKSIWEVSEKFRRAYDLGRHGQALIHLTDVSLRELGVLTATSRDYVLGELRRFVQSGGVPADTMRESRAAAVKRRREQQACERELLSTWTTNRGLSQSILTAAAVDLSDKGLRDDDMHAVALLIKFNETMTTLWLGSRLNKPGGNNIGDQGAITLGEALKDNATLTHLDLSWNKIGDEGASGIGKGLKANSTLTSLSLWSNEIGHAGAIGLGEGLKANATLTSLWLGWQGCNTFGDASKSAIQTAWLSQTQSGRQDSGLHF
jgi:hypothetical protein